MNPKIFLQKNREQSWLFGHPWIFSKAIKEFPLAEEGSLVSVFSYDNAFLGTGYFNKNQTIAIRMLTKENEVIQTNWFVNKLSILKRYREKFLNQTTAYRLCYGESDKIPGLVIDVYSENAVVQVNTKGIEKLLHYIKEALLEIGYKHIIVDSNSISAKKEKVNIKSQNEDLKQLEALENGFRILIPQEKAQKTGWFCDQRENRELVEQLVKNQKINSVLNLFSYTGGFSLYALRGGAKKVVNVDQDEAALELFKKMAIQNNLSPNYDNVHLDIWDFFQNNQDTFDLVIVDPPAFVKEEAKKLQGLKGYLNVFKQAIPKVKKGGFMMVYSCSHFIKEEDLQWVLRQSYQFCNREFQTVKLLKQGLDHPCPAWFEESNYLKGYLLAEVL
jgi:23S rRNA (cytosine1962-C5)-methyltransferase